jgi:hypothetical protein
MNKFYCKLSLLVFFLFTLVAQSNAQKFDVAVEYLSYINDQHRGIMSDYLSYSSAVAHGKSARKVENRRQTLMSGVKDATKKVSAMPPFKGDKSLRDSTVSFLKFFYLVLNDDYGKILNMEEIAEQSYDAMEAYLLAQEIAGQKLKEADDRVELVVKEFAAKNNITLNNSGNDQLVKKFEAASEANAYYRVLYLIFFKSNKQDLYLMEALGNKNVNALEQNMNTLNTYADEGLKKLDTIKAFKGDRTLINSCRQALQFYKNEAAKMSVASAYLLKEENFNKVKKAFDSKKESDRKQEDVDTFNKAVNEFNKAVNEFNAVNNQLNSGRSNAVDNWNKTVAAFLEKHVPKYK